MGIFSSIVSGMSDGISSAVGAMENTELQQKIPQIISELIQSFEFTLCADNDSRRDFLKKRLTEFIHQECGNAIAAEFAKQEIEKVLAELGYPDIWGCPTICPPGKDHQEHYPDASPQTRKHQKTQNQEIKMTDKNKPINEKQNIFSLMRTAGINQWVEKLETNRLWWVNKHQYLLDSETGLIWCVPKNYDAIYLSRLNPAAGPKFFGRATAIPQANHLIKFAHISGNPLRGGQSYRIKNYGYWLAQENKKLCRVDLDAGYEASRGDSGDGRVIWCCTEFAGNLRGFIKFATHNNIAISSLDQPDDHIVMNIFQPYLNIDYRRCRLPQISATDMTDMHKGMWEAFGLSETEREEYGLSEVVARNPAEDIRSGNIGIDFGTSSTVVSFEDENGRAHLLRVGARDFYEAPKPEHYENPTMLEFLDFRSFNDAWQEMAQQPLVSWDFVRCSHEALHNFRNNDGAPEIVGSILGKIKQWALRESSDTPVRIRDQISGFEHELAPLTKRNPVLSSVLQVGRDYVFDPIELYAWFLGLNINWRNRGIFLKYFMTFPVAYPKDVKEKILSSFRRGLWRSLPAALTENTEVMEKFSVQECAAEPAAYVAAAVKSYQLDPEDGKMAYAVFDFGGGTTDFDFGYYRWANEEEEAKGIEEVFERYESSGDKFLGGENLLENLAYRVFIHNVDTCRKNQIVFTRPLDADNFSGSELLLDKTQAAHTNTLMLMSRLRPFWEQGVRTGSGVEKISLLNRNGDKTSCELSVPYNELQEYLENRIREGIRSFFTAMKKAFGDSLPSPIHIFLAGNSSRSRMVTDSFGLLPEENVEEVSQKRNEAVQAIIGQVFGDVRPEIIAHAPLQAEAGNDFVPTAKTGVALGILRLCPGNGVEVINCAGEATGDEAPFAYYVGDIRRGKFRPGICRSDVYNEWKQIGVVSSNAVFNLYYTQSNHALSGEMEQGHSELYRKQIHFSGDAESKKVFARAVGPAKIELCAADDVHQAEQGKGGDLQELLLG